VALLSPDERPWHGRRPGFVMPSPAFDPPPSQDSDVYVKTDAGCDEIHCRTAGLPIAARAILLMVDGHRTVAALQPLIAGSNASPDVLADLAGRGLIELLGNASGRQTMPAVDGPESAVDWWNVAPDAPDAGEAGAGCRKTSANRYEHLYTMMNDIVRDFLAPHRRYLFQIRIERCRSADELVELLHGLQAVLAKARGESFASDVVARLRSAAG
jgi:DNA gyrase/topoisomerase IV subunit B